MKNYFNKFHFIIAGPIKQGGVATFNKRLFHSLSELGLKVSYLGMSSSEDRISLMKLLFMKKKDIIFISSLYTSFLLFLPFYKKVFILHGFRPFNQGFFKALFSYFSMGFGAQRGHVVISNSELTRSFYKRFMNLDSKVIPLIFEPDIEVSVSDPLMTANKDIDLLFVGRLVSQKNVDVIIESLHRYHTNSDHKLKFYILGDGSELDRLRNLTKELGEESNVYFEGYVSHEDISAYYKRAKCFISLGLLEPYGLVFEEVLPYKIPIILHRYTGILEFNKTPNMFPVSLTHDSILEAFSNVFDKVLPPNVEVEERAYFHDNLLQLLN
jgi:glycosyltransferase involved in cell wall biosynthesis